MLPRRWLIAAIATFSLVLAACGSSVVGGPSAYITPTESPSSGNGQNTSPPTVTSGPISIATDHSAYAPTDVIQVTVTNQSQAALYAYDEQASCSILSLFIQQNGTWVSITAQGQLIASCAMKKVTLLIAIAPGTSYQHGIMAGYLRQGDAGFLPGTYRLTLHYFDSPPSQPNDPPAGSSHTITSQSWTVSPNVPPQPLPTVNTTPGSGSGSGTVLPVTVVP